MSPFLFTIAMEYLSRIISHKTSSHDFNFHPRCRKIKLTHLCYADDIILFCRGDLGSIRILKEALDLFGDISGLRCNAEKSEIYLAGVDQQTEADITQLLNFKVGSLPIKYLGLPMNAKKPAINDYRPLINSITKTIDSWQAKSLSYAGRFQLVTSVISSMSSYWANIFLIPKTVIRKIEALARSYLWSGKHGSRKALVAWSNVCKDKKEGGLGIKEVLSWNRACAAKAIFELHNVESNIWRQWIYAYKIKQGDIWSVEAAAGDSFGWKSINRIKKQLLSSNSQAHILATMTKPSGKYNTGLMYELWNPPGTDVEWAKHIWGSHHIPRHSFIAWIAYHERLPTLSRMLEWGIASDSTCKLCSTHPETEEHLFFRCSFSQQVFTKLKAHTRCSSTAQDLKGMAIWLTGTAHLGLNGYKKWCCMLTTLIYTIWRVRNKLMHTNTSTTVEECSLEAWTAITEKMQSRNR